MKSESYTCMCSVQKSVGATNGFRSLVMIGELAKGKGLLVMRSWVVSRIFHGEA